MKSEKRFLETYVYSTAGIVCMAALLIGANFILARVHVRADLTQEKLYTLSPGTETILKDMKTPVAMRFYFSEDATELPVQWKSFARRFEDLLREYERAADGKITITKLNPLPDSEEEDSATLDGIHGQPVGGGQRIYFGLAISAAEVRVALPFLSMERENLLEYDITRAIYRLQHPEKPVVGVMSAAGVMGQQQMNPMMMQMPNQGKPAWLIIDQLKRHYEVREIATDVDEIPEDIDVLMLVHPAKLPDKTMFALDQYVLRGGKMVAFLDPLCFVAEADNPMARMQYTPPTPSDLGDLLEAWGIEFDTEKVVADMVYKTGGNGQGGAAEERPAVLALPPEAMNADDPVTSQLELVVCAFAGAFKGTPAKGLKEDVLISTSDQAGMVEKFMAQMGGAQIKKDLEIEIEPLALAIRLTGTFTTAFPDGKPEDEEKQDDDNDDETDSDESDGAELPALTESTAPGAVILVGDADMVHDQCSGRKQRSWGGGEVLVPFTDNWNLVQNLIEQLSGDSNLISLRCRGALRRPFTLIREKRAQAEEKYRGELKAQDDLIAKTQKELSELQREKSEDELMIISPEQQAAINKLEAKMKEVEAARKELHKKLRRDVDFIENCVKWSNILVMPGFVVLVGLFMSWVRSRRAPR